MKKCIMGAGGCLLTVMATIAWGAGPLDILPPIPDRVEEPRVEGDHHDKESVLGRLAQTERRHQAQAITDEEVMKAIQGGVDHLLAYFETAPGKPVKATASHVLGAFALLYASRHLDDPRLRTSSPQMEPVIRWLVSLKTDRTYLCALQAAALAQLPNKPEYRRPLQEVTDRLVKGTSEPGAYTYRLGDPSALAGSPGARPGRTFDNSNSQYGLLGAWSAADAGVEVPMAYWLSVDEHWRRVQHLDGGWTYVGPTASQRATMTAAGLASLYVCSEYIDLKTSLEPREDKTLERGMVSFIHGFTPDSTNLYYQYGVERVGHASGFKFFGNRSWFRESAATLLSLQNADGSFRGSGMGNSAMVNTSYAVLFLIRGRTPVIMNKLQHDGPWNARPRDSANIHRYFEKKFERPVVWQIVPSKVSHEEWMDAPILLITGTRDPQFDRSTIDNIRAFVHAGGMVFSTSDGTSLDFDRAMRRYAGIISGGLYEMRELPPEHLLYNVHSKIKGETAFLGMSNGAREWWVHSKADLGDIWQKRLVSKRTAWDFPANLYLYTTGYASLRSKLQSLAVSEPKSPPKHVLRLTRLEYAGNWNPEPGAWPRFAKLAARDFNTSVSINTLRVSDLNAKAPTVAHLTGTSPFTLPEPQVAVLREYLYKGGTLVIDNCGGSDAFTKSVEALVGDLFPESQLEPLPPEHPIYSGRFSARATPIGEVDYRRSFVEHHGRVNKPQLKGLKIGNRYGIYFSPFDITSGLIGTHTLGISGYAADSAQKLSRNLLLYASGADDRPPAPPPVAPASTRPEPTHEGTGLPEGVTLPPSPE